MEDWIPKTELGRRVMSREIIDLNIILDNGWNILEPQITDTLVPDLESDLLMIGQSKGKFGGGRRRVFRQTQKKTREGNKPRFAAYAVVGNQDGFVGLGYGKARETVPARDKAIRQAKLNVFKIARGSGSWESHVQEPHTVPFRVEGQCGSVRVVLFPAPKGKGLIAEKEIQKILQAAGISDVWSRTFGQTKNKINLIKATEAALRSLVTTKVRPEDVKNLSIVYGTTKAPAIAAPTQMQVSSPRAIVSEQPKQVAKTPQKEEKAPVKTEPAPAKEQAAVQEDLTAVKGVGPARVKKLGEVGITTPQQLAAEDPKALAEKSSVSEGVAQKLVAAAKKHLEGRS